MKDVKESLDLVAQLESAAMEGTELPDINLSFEHKESVDRVVLVLDRLEHSSEYFRKKAKEFAEVARQLEHAQAKIEKHVKDMAENQGVSDFFGTSYRFKISRAQPKLLLDEAALPESFKTEITKVVADRSKIEAALDRGEEVPGAEYQKSYSIRPYPNKALEIA